MIIVTTKARGLPSHHSAGIVDIPMKIGGEDMNIQITMRTMGQMTRGGRGLVTRLVIMTSVCSPGPGSLTPSRHLLISILGPALYTSGPL